MIMSSRFAKKIRNRKIETWKINLKYVRGPRLEHIPCFGGIRPTNLGYTDADWRCSWCGNRPPKKLLNQYLQIKKAYNKLRI